MQAETQTFTTPDGIPILVRTFEPDGGHVRGVVQILHGLAEHSARYARVAEALTGAGWAVITHDHRGHGSSVRDEGDRGHFADVDGWSRAVDDIATVHDLADKRWPDQPHALFGHSMGSSLAVHALFTHGDLWDAAVLSGPTGVVGFMRVLGALVARLERRRLGGRGRSRLLHAMSFSDFNKAFQPARTEYDWLSRDPAEVDKYANDPRCGFVVTTQHWCDHLVALGALGDEASLSRIPHDLPLFVFYGDKDPVGGQGKRVHAMVALMRKVGIRSIDVKPWPDGRHEMLNDIVRDKVTAELLAWLDGHVSR